MQRPSHTHTWHSLVHGGYLTVPGRCWNQFPGQHLQQGPGLLCLTDPWLEGRLGEVQACTICAACTQLQNSARAIPNHCNSPQHQCRGQGTVYGRPPRETLTPLAPASHPCTGADGARGAVINRLAAYAAAADFTGTAGIGRGGRAPQKCTPAAARAHQRPPLQPSQHCSSSCEVRCAAVCGARQVHCCRVRCMGSRSVRAPAAARVQPHALGTRLPGPILSHAWRRGGTCSQRSAAEERRSAPGAGEAARTGRRASGAPPASGRRCSSRRTDGACGRLQRQGYFRVCAHATACRDTHPLGLPRHPEQRSGAGRLQPFACPNAGLGRGISHRAAAPAGPRCRQAHAAAEPGRSPARAAPAAQQSPSPACPLASPGPPPPPRSSAARSMRPALLDQRLL